jgi:hypothetical protein
MGLDMFAFAVPANEAGDAQVDVSPPEGYEEVAYWRKFNHLHGWMERLYRSKGGTADSFNCVTVRLMPEDLDQLEKDLASGLPPTAGFFFGGPEIYPEDVDRTREFIAKARGLINSGEAVFYDSWW